MSKVGKTFGLLVFILSIVFGCYIGGWVMFIRPIIECCKAFDTGLLSGEMIGWTVVKCIFAGLVGSIIIYIGGIIYTGILVIFD